MKNHRKLQEKLLIKPFSCPETHSLAYHDCVLHIMIVYLQGNIEMP